MDDLANLDDPGLEHAVGRGISHHQGGEPVPVQFRLGAQVGDIDVAVGVAADDDDRQAGQNGARRVGAVGGTGDQTDVPRRVAATLMPGADDKKPGEFALGSGVGLQRDGGEAGRRAQHVFQFRDQLQRPLGLVQRRKGMQAANSGHDTGSISAAAFSFMVQEPSGIMASVSDRSFAASRCR